MSIGLDRHRDKSVPCWKDLVRRSPVTLSALPKVHCLDVMCTSLVEVFFGDKMKRKNGKKKKK